MNIEHIKKLRSETGLSMVLIQSYLKTYNGDYDKAKEALLSMTRENKQKNDRVASKGMIKAYIDQDDVYIFELIGETDFVYKHPLFIKLLDDLFEVAKKHKPEHLDILSNLSIYKHDVNTYISQIANRVGENIFLRRYEKLKKEDGQSFSLYQHHDGKHIGLLILNTGKKEIADTLAMQIVAMDALFKDYTYLTEADQQKMLSLFQETTHNNQSFDDFLKAKSLIDQPYIKDATMSVRQVLDEHHLSIISMFRYQLGEGISDKLECRLDLGCDGAPSVQAIDHKKAKEEGK